MESRHLHFKTLLKKESLVSTDFWCVNKNSGKPKITLITFGWRGSKNGLPFRSWTLKSAVSQEWIDEMSCFFACWSKFRKTKSYFDNYWVVMVKNEHGLTDDGTVKSDVSQNDLMNWADWLNDSCMLIVIEWFLVWWSLYSISLTFKFWTTTAVLLSQNF